MVKPGGTGSPMRLISARLAPFPPSSGFMVPLPAAFLLPNEYTYFRDFEFIAITRLSNQVSPEKFPQNHCPDFSKGQRRVNYGLRSGSAASTHDFLASSRGSKVNVSGLP